MYMYFANHTTYLCSKYIYKLFITGIWRQFTKCFQQYKHFRSDCFQKLQYTWAGVWIWLVKAFTRIYHIISAYRKSCWVYVSKYFTYNVQPEKSGSSRYDFQCSIRRIVPYWCQNPCRCVHGAKRPIRCKFCCCDGRLSHGHQCLGACTRKSANLQHQIIGVTCWCDGALLIWRVSIVNR